MNRWFKSIAATLLVATSAAANPQLFVTYMGTVGTNHEWSVAVAPDPAYFSNTTSGFGSSMAVELAFAVQGSSIVTSTIIHNPTDWDFETVGNNPFTNTLTDGLWVSANWQQAFAAYGSRVFLSGTPVPLISFQTLGTSPTIVHYGLAASGHPTKGSIIAQSGQNFPVESAGFASVEPNLLFTDFVAMGGTGSGYHEFFGYSGSVQSIPEPCAVALALAGAPLGILLIARRRR